MIHSYRVWFLDGSACLVDAETPNRAESLALAIAKQNGDPDAVVKRIERLGGLDEPMEPPHRSQEKGGSTND